MADRSSAEVVTRITLVLGGTRSGKSAIAERIAGRSGAPVTYVATGQPADPAMAERIASHQRRRAHRGWSTVELAGDQPATLADALRSVPGTALLDALGTWTASFPDLEPDAAGLIAALIERRAAGRPTVVVSEEVGLSVHPETPVGRQFVDVLGDLNRAVAGIADDVLLVVAGRVLPLARWDH